MPEFVVNLINVMSFDEFVAAVNDSLCVPAGGFWQGRNWDAFNDYLSWPDPPQYQLVFRGWSECAGLNQQDRECILNILAVFLMYLAQYGAKFFPRNQTI